MALARAASLLSLAAFTSGSSDYVWQTDPYFYTPAQLPSAGTPSCCGAGLVADPSTSTSGYDCLCDLNDGVCDTDCCCDVDCSYDALRPGGFFGCVTNDTVTAPSGYTTCSDQVISTNLPDGSGVVRAFGGENGLLCIVSDNSPSRGSYYDDLSTRTATQVTRELDDIFASGYTTPIEYSYWLTPGATNDAQFYTIGDPIKGEGCLDTTALTGCYLANMLLPALSVNGDCTGQQALTFLRDVPPFSCSLKPAGQSFKSICETMLNPRFLHALNFSSAPSSLAANVPLAFVVTDTNSSTVSANIPAASSYDDATNTCSNAMTVYQLRFFVSPTGTLDNVIAYVQLDVIHEDEFDAASVTYGAGFEYTGQQGGRETSGRPGYQRGLPLVVADGTAVRRDGLLMLPRSSAGECGSGSSGAVPALWRESMARTCTQRLTAAELEAECTKVPANNQPLIEALNLTAVGSSTVKIGLFGDSHPDRPEDWVDLVVKYPQNSPSTVERSWDAVKKTCSNVLSGMHLRILYTKTGLYSTPSEKVVGAELIFTRRSVTAARCALGMSCDTTISVTATTSYAELDAGTYEYVPRTPTIIPSLPYDFFYPFHTG